jgi:hypothetical protein
MSRTIKDLLIEWEERRERGEVVSVETLCADAPWLAPELERLISRLESADRLLDVNPVETVPDSPQGPAVAMPARIGRYEVRAELGRGATCVVYRAWDPDLRLDVALKVLHLETPQNRQQQPALASRLMLEAQALAQLRHDHIVRIYEPGLTEGRPYFVLEYVRGGSLRDRLAELSSAGPCAFVPLLEQVARAVHYAHERRILHRDLKPGNILLAEDGRALVSDFGLAKLLQDAPPPAGDAEDTVTYPESEGPDASMRLTATGFQPGTPAYMAPEQHAPAFGDVSPATDVWALGVILYELLTGQKPFPGRTRAEVAAQVCAGQLVRPRERRPGADRYLEAIALRCLQTVPRRRYQTAGEVAAALAAWQARRRLRRRLPKHLAVGALFVTLVGLGAAVWVREASPERRYQRKLRDPVEALRRNEAVSFIFPGRAPPPTYRVRAGEQGTIVGQAEDALVISGAARCCLVELCPEVPLEHYRLRAKVRFIEVLSGDPWWGVYVNYSQVNTDPGPQHYFEAAYFVDTAGLAGRRQPLGPPCVSAALSQRWFSYVHVSPSVEGDQFPYRQVTGNSDLRAPSVSGPVPGGAWDGSWRTIEVEVHGSKVSARCSGGGLTQELHLGKIGVLERNGFELALRHLYPDLRGVNLKMNGTAAGVYVDSGICVVGEFVIEALPAP